LGWFTGAALAQTSAPAPIAQGAAASGQAPTNVSTKAARKRTRNSRIARRAVAERREAARKNLRDEDSLASCLTMWEPATHMTKPEWARACHRLADRLKDMT
jgi:hypothetical protein